MRTKTVADIAKARTDQSEISSRQTAMSAFLFMSVAYTELEVVDVPVLQLQERGGFEALTATPVRPRRGANRSGASRNCEGNFACPARTKS